MIRKGMEQHRIYHAKQRRVRSDAQGQSDDGDDGERWVLRQHSHAVVQILPERVHQHLPAPVNRVIFKFCPDPSYEEEYLLSYLRRIRSKASHCDISERITLSPTFKPSRISMVFTELRPNLTFTRTASAPSSTSLKSPMVLSD